MPDKKNLDELKKRLEKTKEKLESEIADLKKPVDMGDDIDHFDEEADEAEEFSANMGMLQTLKMRYERVKRALMRMAGRSYGTCVKCGQNIEIEVLNADPESDFCKNCKLARRKK